MTKSQELEINPAVLEWARKAAGLSIPQVAQSINIPADKLREIEHTVGKYKINTTLLHYFAQQYDRSFEVFFLPEPPKDYIALTDYRTLPTSESKIGPDTARCLRAARQLQEELSDLSNDNPDILPSFNPPTISVKDKTDDVATNIRKYLDISIDTQRRWSDSPQAFREWRAKLQMLGIVVLIEDFPREEARGFSLWDADLIPMIVVSRNEAPVAQIFTLFHELAHLLFNSDAICLKQESKSTAGITEARCNRIAAATLVPESALREMLTKQNQTTVREWPSDDLWQMATRFRVSRHVIAIRLEGLGFAPSGYYNKIKGFLDPDDYIIAQRKQLIKTDKPFRRDISRERLFEMGFVATNAILKACKTSALSTMDAAEFLKVSPIKFDRLYTLGTAQSRRYS